MKRVCRFFAVHVSLSRSWSLTTSNSYIFRFSTIGSGPSISDLGCGLTIAVDRSSNSGFAVCSCSLNRKWAFTPLSLPKSGSWLSRPPNFTLSSLSISRNGGPAFSFLTEQPCRSYSLRSVWSIVLTALLNISSKPGILNWVKYMFRTGILIPLGRDMKMGLCSQFSCLLPTQAYMGTPLRPWCFSSRCVSGHGKRGYSLNPSAPKAGYA